jgi:hypothetical protein
MQVGADRYVLSLAEAAAESLLPGDSVSLSPRASDAEGNPAGLHFIPVLFPRTVEAKAGPMRLRENPVHGASFDPEAGVRALIPVSATGEPLGGPDIDRKRAAARGPVFEIPMEAPIARIRLGFHDHLGGFVNSVDRAFTDAEWDAMKAASPGDTTWVRLMWYPVSRDGARLATGAYVVEGRLWTRDGVVERAEGGAVQVKGGSMPLKPRLFGYLRD